MSVTNIVKDNEGLTMTITADYDVSAERAWRLWADPRQLERWWGPPTYPATVLDHSLSSHGSVTYVMTGPELDQHYGYWEVLEAAPPRHLHFLNGFANSHGMPNDDMPRTHMTVSIEDGESGGVNVSIECRFPSVEAMEQLLAMGMDDGLCAAVGQIGAILAGP